MLHNLSRRLTLVQATLFPQIPLWISCLIGMSGAVWYIGEIDAMAYALNESLHQGSLSPQDLNNLASMVRWGWLTGLLILGLCSMAGLGLVVMSYRLMVRRLEEIRVYADKRVSGEDVPPLRISGNGPLAQIEHLIHDISGTIYERDEDLHHEIELSHFDSEFQRALDMTDTEKEALDIVELSLEMIVPGLSAELLLADNNQATLHRVAASRGLPVPGCPVSSPKACSAIRRGQTLRFSSSEALDACPRLREHSHRPCGATCTPLNVMGHSIGVLHLTSAIDELPNQRAVDFLDVVASKTGARLGMLRTLASTQKEAQTDPLTGLLNRRSFEAIIESKLLEDPEKTHSIVMADLDHFKKLNDTEGHEAGDHALKLFAELLKDSLRPQDVVGRHGGEEFVIFLQHCEGSHAVIALTRFQERLHQALVADGSAYFTASFGVAVFPAEGRSLPSLLRRADRSLYEAKNQGRNCVVTSEMMNGPNSTNNRAPKTPEVESEGLNLEIHTLAVPEEEPASLHS